MGFAQSSAIVQPSDVARITFEAALGGTNLDSGNATVAGLCNEATNAIIRDIQRVRGKDPSTVLNTGDFTYAAAHWVRWQYFASLPQGDKENADKAKDSEARYREELKTIFIQTPDAIPSNAPKGIPSFMNLDATPNLNRPVDNRIGRAVANPYWKQSP